MMKLKNHFNATRFDFQLHVHTLQPWPSSNKAIAIGWQRGKRRRGATSSVLPVPTPEKNGSTVVRFNERINFKSTLYKAPGATERPGQLGPYKRKCVILAVLETDGRTHATAALGRVVIDLAEFASIDGQELRTFTVACSKAIQAAVGEPQLTVTLRCRWKKAGADFTEDEAASMSTDQSGSTLTGNIRDFFTRMTSSRAAGQELRAFARSGGGGGAGAASPMEAIGEDDGTPGGARRRSLTGNRGGGGGGASWGGSPRNSQDLDEADWEGAMEYPVEGTLNIHDGGDDDDEPDDASLGGAGGGGVTGGGVTGGGVARGGAGAARPAAAAAAAAARGVPAAAVAEPAETGEKKKKTSRWNILAKSRSSKRSDSDSGRSSGAPTPEPATAAAVAAAAAAVASTAITMPAAAVAAAAPPRERKAAGSGSGKPPKSKGRSSSRQAGGDALGGDPMGAVQDELLTAAAMEFCLHLAQRPIVAGRRPSRAVHAPARRIARTLVCLGRQDGVPFGHTVLRHIQSSVVANRSDIGQLAFWWSNACHMRGFLQSLNLVMPHEGDGEVQMHWAAQTFVPRLLGQEKFIFDELVSYVWTHTLVPKVAMARARPPPGGVGASANRRGAHEAALRKWLEALEGANSQLKALGREGHINMLRQQVLLELLKRVDALLFHYLVHPTAGDASATPATSGGGAAGDAGDAALVMDSRNPNMPVLDDSMLFFTRGALTFGTGMQLKMACTRLQQWAFGEGGLRDIWAQLPEQGQALFRLLKGASDLLMMPKDMLLDEGIREETVPLPIGTIAYMLSRFAPDDYAPDGIPPGVLAALRRAAAAAGVDSSAPPALEVEAECTYYSPTDDMVMERVEIGEEPGLEFSEASEDELEAVSELGADFGAPPPLRFKLLHNLWCAGVPRTRRVTIQRVEM